MQQENIRSYLEDFFTINNCEIIEKKNTYFTTQLTIDMDKKLMNRPFYWHYLEKCGGEPNPLKLTLITDNEEISEEERKDLKGEVVHFGSPRLHQIFNATRDFGSFCCMYENVKSTTNSPLTPWLGVNFKISYKSHRQKDILLSLGVQLINGKVTQDFQDKLNKLDLSPKIPDYCYTLSPIITPFSGYNRLEKVVEDIIMNDEHTWIAEAKKLYKDELKILEHFYVDVEEKPESYSLEKKALKEQYNTSIDVEVVNGGVFYLNHS